MNRYQVLTLAILVCLQPVHPLAGQVRNRTATLRGVVLDAASRRPLPRVMVELPSQARQVETDSAGEFVIAELQPQLVPVRLRAIGFQTVQRGINLFAGRVTRIEYVMSPQATALPEVRVSAPGPATVLMEGFEERRRHGFGTFFVAEQLERSHHRQVTDLVREAVGVRVVRATAGGVHLANSRRTATGPGAGRPCYLQVVVDGLIFWTPGAGGQVTVRSGPPPDLGGFISISELAGIEIYSGMAGVPVEFRREGAHCGALILWTKR
ncbi:MAG TPA: carboxypeptidase regulatory-like domain-containing protein, partial [Gemmatimonadaceae bacterium]|nr:carboxypeptidase regulatory-like domain-containing protein [Gemmatimonadaceae bacterium]